MRQETLIFSLFLIVLAFVGCGPEELGPLKTDAQASVYVSGSIYSLSEERYIEGALVEIEETGTATASNSIGHFELGQVTPGEYRFRVTSAGLQTSAVKTIPETEHYELTVLVGQSETNSFSYLYEEGNQWFLRKSTSDFLYDRPLLDREPQYTSPQHPVWHPLKNDTLLFTAILTSTGRRDVFELNTREDCTLNCVTPLYQDAANRNVTQAQYSPDGRHLYLLMDEILYGTLIDYPARFSVEVLPTAKQLIFEVPDPSGTLRPVTRAEVNFEITGQVSTNPSSGVFALCDARISSFRIHHRTNLMAFLAESVDTTNPRTFICGQPQGQKQVFALTLGGLLSTTQTTPPLAVQITYLNGEPGHLAFSPDAKTIYFDLKTTVPSGVFHTVRGASTLVQNRIIEPLLPARTTPYEFDMHPYRPEIIYNGISTDLDNTGGFMQFYTLDLAVGAVQQPKRASQFHYAANPVKPLYYLLNPDLFLF